MTKTIGTLGLLFLWACAASSDLTKEERAKLDPAIMRLFSGAPVDEREYDVAVGPQGEKAYEVIIRAKTAGELKSEGIKIQSAAGDVITARLSLKELRRILKFESVRSVENGSRNYLH